MSQISRFEEFICAIQRGECEDVRRLFERGFINKTGTDGLKALHFACVYNTNDSIVKYLLSEGCGIEDESGSGWRPIHYAAYCGHSSALTTLIERGCSLDCVDLSGASPLDLASSLKKEECVRILQASKARKAAVEHLKTNSLSKIIDTETGRTLLDHLLSYDCPVIMNEIRSKRVDEQEIKDWKSLRSKRMCIRSYQLLHECLLWRCIYQKYDDGVYVLCIPAIVNIDSLFMGPSPLETAVEFGTLFCVKHILGQLLEEGESWTRAANFAKVRNIPNMLALISERRVYLNGKKTIGFSRLHTAVLDNDCGMIEFLLKNKIVNPDEVHKIFGTALSLAYSLNHMECVQILQKSNVNVNIVDRFGQFPLHVAITNNIEDHCDHLVNNMTNLETKDYMNVTVLERAVINNHKNVCQLLVKKGARCDKYMNFPASLDVNQDFSVLLQNAHYLPITKKESIYSLCLKINRTIYPCLLDTIDQHTVNYTDGEENTLLHLCAIFLMPRLCSELILKSANVNSINMYEGTPLMELLKYNYGRNMEQIEGDLIETVNILIDGGASLNIIDYNDHSIVDRATEFHNEKLLLALIKKKERLECIKEPQLSTWLCDKYFTVIKEVIPLLNKSSLTEWITKDRIKSILQEADLSLAKIMYDHASHDVKTSVLETILYFIILSISNKTLFQNCTIDKMLFVDMTKDEISTESSLESGESLLICLIRDRNEEFIKLLLRSRNASFFLEKRNAGKKLPLHICIECDYWDIMDQIIVDTTSVNEEDNDGNTPLSLLLGKFSQIAEERMVDRLMTFVKMLIKQSADIYKVNKLDRTVISYCELSHVKSDIETYFRQHQHFQQQGEGDTWITLSTVPSTNTENQSLPICGICANEPINCTLNCGHTCCKSCAEKVIDCFVCRTRITARIKMFL